MPLVRVSDFKELSVSSLTRAAARVDHFFGIYTNEVLMEERYPCTTTEVVSLAVAKVRYLLHSWCPVHVPTRSPNTVHACCQALSDTNRAEALKRSADTGRVPLCTVPAYPSMLQLVELVSVTSSVHHDAQSACAC